MKVKLLIALIAFTGVFLFFPLPVGQSTCLFGHLSGICLYREMAGSHEMMRHYVRFFALPWWGSIGLAVYVLHSWRRKPGRNNQDDRLTGSANDRERFRV